MIISKERAIADDVFKASYVEVAEWQKKSTHWPTWLVELDYGR